MDIDKFKSYLESIYDNKKIVSSRISEIKRINSVYDVDEEYKEDKCATLLNELSNSSNKIIINGNRKNVLGIL